VVAGSNPAGPTNKRRINYPGFLCPARSTAVRASTLFAIA
jgi:hypothetical protein